MGDKLGHSLLANQGRHWRLVSNGQEWPNSIQWGLWSILLLNNQSQDVISLDL